MAYFLDVAILIGDAELAKCLAQHCASFPRSRWRYQEFVKISQHDGTVSAMDIQEQDVLMAALAASVALETLQADDLSVVEAVVLLGDEAKFLLERSGGRERLGRDCIQGLRPHQRTSVFLNELATTLRFKKGQAFPGT